MPAVIIKARRAEAVLIPVRSEVECGGVVRTHSVRPGGPGL